MIWSSTFWTKEKCLQRNCIQIWSEQCCLPPPLCLLPLCPWEAQTWGKPFGRGRSLRCSPPAHPSQEELLHRQSPPLGIIPSLCRLTTLALLNPKKSSKQNLLSSVPQSDEKQQTCWVKCKVSSIFIWLIRIAHQMKTKKWFTAELVQVVVA